MRQRSGGLLVTSRRLALLAWLRRRSERLPRCSGLVMLLLYTVGGAARREFAGSALLRGRRCWRKSARLAPAAFAARAAAMPATAAASAAAAPLTALSTRTTVGATLRAIARGVLLLADRLTGAWLAARCGRWGVYRFRRTCVGLPIPRRAPLLIPVMIPRVAITLAIAPISTTSLSAPAVTVATPWTAL